jgi:hypothetical protein
MLIFVINFILLEVVTASDCDQRKHGRNTNFSGERDSKKCRAIPVTGREDP